MKNKNNIDKGEILVGIHCITYNQKDYIRQCLDGFVMQKTNFNFMAYVGDDCSTDGTTEIIKEYEQKYPNIIKGIYHTNNTNAVGNYFDVVNVCKSKYVAVCEGDDYWIDEYKLQKQVDFLESHSDYSICFNRTKVIYQGFDYKVSDNLYPTKRTIRKGLTLDTLLKSNFIATASVMYRWKFYKTNVEECFPRDIVPGDWYLHLLHAKVGKIKMLPDIMSIYRRNPGGIWSNSIKDMDKIYLKYGYGMIGFYDCVYNNIVDSSQEYMQNVLLPEFEKIVYAHYCNKKFKELQDIYEKYPKYTDMIFANQKVQNSKFKIKYNKYKKLFQTILIGFIIESLFVVFILIV